MFGPSARSLPTRESPTGDVTLSPHWVSRGLYRSGSWQLSAGLFHSLRLGGIGLAERSCNRTRPVLARPSVSNAVALVDILRCPVVVADQAAGQKDVEADLWVGVSAV